VYPKWVIAENKMAEVQTVLQAMYNQLANMSMTPEQAFSIYDRYDSGLCSQDEFNRLVKTFFGEVLSIDQVPIVLKLTEATGDIKVRYRDFCRLLDKKFVKTFTFVKEKGLEQQDNAKQKSALEMELERPIVKEASLSYILKKAAELQIDLRRELMGHDPLDLSVISRVGFWGIMLSLPLGLNEEELIEVFDHDLNFDNNGNVDYMSILNSDLFVALERKRITALALSQ
jgi:hypothetical protein